MLNTIDSITNEGRRMLNGCHRTVTHLENLLRINESCVDDDLL
jgi:hypothetical protein